MDKAAASGAVRRSKTSETHVLPPCGVCGGKAVGFHFGVNVCAACKSFFKRMVKKPPPTRACDGRCVPQAGRAQCMYCRYTRCVQAGMSLSAAKRGRYTQHMKVENMIAAKTHSEKEQKHASASGFSLEPVDTRLSTSSSNASSSPQSLGWDASPTSSTDSPQSKLATDSPQSGQLSSGTGPSDSDESMAELQGSLDSCSSDTGQDSHSFDGKVRGVNGTIGTPVDLTVDMGPTVTASSGVSQEQLQNLTDFLERIFIQHAVIDSDNVALSLRAKYLEERRLRHDLFGTLKPLEWEEYKRIHDATGLDVDGRKQKLLSCVESADKPAEHFIGFCQDIPGFSDLPPEDQMRILTGNMFYFVTMLDYPYCNTHDKIFTSPLKNRSMGEDELLLYCSQDDVDCLFKIMERLQSFHLNNKEKALLTTIMLLRPEHSVTPTGMQHLRRATTVLTEALQLQFSKTHPSCPRVLQNTLSVVQTLSDSGRRIFSEFTEKYKALNASAPTNSASDTVDSLEDKVLIKMLKLTENSQL